jgi:hypothetical protein
MEIVPFLSYNNGESMRHWKRTPNLQQTFSKRSIRELSSQEYYYVKAKKRKRMKADWRLFY